MANIRKQAGDGTGGNRVPTDGIASGIPGEGFTKTPAETAAPARAKQMLQTVLKIGFAVGLIYWLVHKGILDINTFAQLATPAFIASVMTCAFLQIFINNYRWQVLLRGQGLETSIGHTLPLTFISLFFNFVMPGGVGGDVVKGYYLLQDYPNRKFTAAMSIFMDRMVGFFVMIATAFLAMFFNITAVMQSNELKSVALAVSLLFVAFIFFFTVALSRRLGRFVFDSFLGDLIFVKLPGGSKIRQVYDVVHSYRNEPMALLKAALLSAVTQLPTVGMVYVVALAMGVHELPISVFFLLVPVGIVVLALPISPAGIGVGQAAFYFLFSLYLGKSSQLGSTAVTVMQVSSFTWGLVGAFFYLRRKKPALPANA